MYVEKSRKLGATFLVSWPSCIKQTRVTTYKLQALIFKIECKDDQCCVLEPLISSMAST